MTMHNGSAVALLYAARQPVRQLVIGNGWARLRVDDDYPIGFADELLDHLEARYREEPSSRAPRASGRSSRPACSGPVGAFGRLPNAGLDM